MLAVYFAGQSSFLAGCSASFICTGSQQISYCNSRWVRAGFCWPMLSQSRFSNRTKCSFRRPVAPSSFFHSLLFLLLFTIWLYFLGSFLPFIIGCSWWTGSWICWSITWAATFDVLNDPPTTIAFHGGFYFQAIEFSWAKFDVMSRDGFSCFILTGPCDNMWKDQINNQNFPEWV